MILNSMHTDNVYTYGNYIVDMSFLAEQLDCVYCGLHLNLKNVFKTEKHGLANKWHISCIQCHGTNLIESSKSHKSDGGQKNFDILL